MRINNYWMKLSMMAIIIKAKVCVICGSRRLRRITQTEALSFIIIFMRKAAFVKIKKKKKKCVNAQQSTCK